MCGRFTLRVSAELIAGEFLVILLEPLPSRYNIAPSQAILVLVGPTGRLWEPGSSKPNQISSTASNAAGRPATGPEADPSKTDQLCSPHSGIADHAQGTFIQPGRTASGSSDRQVVWMQWGIEASGRSAEETGTLMVNLRAETALENPRFRPLLQSHRCIILADGFYEWETLPGSRQPFFIHRKDDRPFGMAGLWKPASAAEPWTLPECVVLTCPANRLIRPIHDRMPAMLRPEDYSLWLDPAVTGLEQLAPTLQPYPEDLLEVYPVSQRVNSADYDQPDCIQRQNRPRQGRLFEPEDH